MYKRQLEEETGQKVGFSVVSNIRLATTQDRMDEYYQYSGVAKTIGVDVKFLTPEQVKEIWPLCNTDGLIGQFNILKMDIFNQPISLKLLQKEQEIKVQKFIETLL